MAEASPVRQGNELSVKKEEPILSHGRPIDGIAKGVAHWMGGAQPADGNESPRMPMAPDRDVAVMTPLFDLLKAKHLNADVKPGELNWSIVATKSSQHLADAPVLDFGRNDEVTSLERH